uniref:IQCH-like ATP-grasp domain-containing protein n=1 Tax=Petromyzon marinus TaxID=7757 RepID=S4R6W5_PETMA
GGHDRAATRIQASWRAFLARRHFERHRRRRWAAGVVAVAWMLRVQRGRVRRSLAQRRQAQLENFRTRAQYLAENWKRIQSSRRTIIHIPSLGYSKHLRRRLKHFDVLQNLQMGRLCDIKDPNVDVIYVSPVPLSDEVLHYYERLLGLSASGGDGTGRYTIIVPDAVVRFPTRAPACCLCSCLTRPRLCARVYISAKGRKGLESTFLVGHTFVDNERMCGFTVCSELLERQPVNSHVLHVTLAEGKNTKTRATINIPPCLWGSICKDQLVESLSRLVAAHAGVRCWLLKTEEGPGGRGTASCPVAQHLPCHRWVLSESRRYGSEQWRHRWAQKSVCCDAQIEAIYIYVKYVQSVDTYNFTQPLSGVIHLLLYIGVINYFVFLSASLILRPCPVPRYAQIPAAGGQIKRLSLPARVCVLHSESVCPIVLEEADKKNVGKTAQHNHENLLLAFKGPARWKRAFHGNPRNCDTGLNYVQMVAIWQRPPKHIYLPLARIDKCRTTSVSCVYKTDLEGPMRCAMKARSEAYPSHRVPRPHTTPAALTHDLQEGLLPANSPLNFYISTADFSAIKERQGTVFTLIHGQRRERLGMMVIMDDLQVALMTFAQNLALIHQQISSADMQGETNFKEAVQEIESILGITVQNRDREEKERESGG